LSGALRKAGHRVLLTPARGGVPALVRALHTRSRAIVFLAVPDAAVSGVARQVAAARDLPPAAAFVHCSGALGLDAIAPLAAGHATGSFHPLQSFPRPRDPDAFRGSMVGIDARTFALRRRLQRLARDLGAKPRDVDDADRVVYHAAAVFASNYLVALAAVAVELLRAIGWKERDAVQGLVPLMRGALSEVALRGPDAALTGPIRRGDLDTVGRHLQALIQIDSRAPRGRSRRADLYRMLGAIALELAKREGLDPTAARRIDRALTRHVAATRRRRR
ncbi:MAG TPA: Rossmann-like and DUF2520 domain-containing protein, partial [Candidatus Dormibacteraeota bacterium]|nr:Rossmann-like and DUF2520 domain-containing protein [Candidatus Dormibacteraeota bacterium]